ncbi:MAG: hypothetical protein FWD12_14865 [Alphaproteobacteria bacterium]|nr:hypothetical protein [Alphaproteobacteria bacterium]
MVRLSVAQPRPLTNSRVAAAAFGAHRGHWNGSISCYPLARNCANPMSKARVLSFSKADSAACARRAPEAGNALARMR